MGACVLGAACRQCSTCPRSAEITGILDSSGLTSSAMGFPTTLAGTLSGNSSRAALFVVGDDEAISRGELERAVKTFASTLKASGIQPGDVVSIAEANTVSHTLDDVIPG